MAIIGAGILGVLAIFVTGVVIFLVSKNVSFNRKRKHIIRVASQTAPEQLDRIYSLVAKCGTEPPEGLLLARTHRTVSDMSCVIPLPTELRGFPWAGRSVVIDAQRKKVVIDIADSTDREPRLLGKIYRLIPVPRQRLKTGKSRNVFAPKQYVAANAELEQALSELCPEYPVDLLAYLLVAGRDSFEFDPMDQARIRTSPSWVQGPEWQVCEQCRKRMVLIVQVPGTLVHPKNFHEGTFWLFGCSTHPENTKVVEQYT